MNPLQRLSETERENLDVLSKFYEKEEAEASRVQVGIERISAFFGSPEYFAFAAIFIIVWIAVNTWGRFHGWRHCDEPPFFYLQGLVSANALLLTIAVLIRQNRMSQLAEHRAHLDLQINLLTEQKVTRLLQLQDNDESVATTALSASEEDKALTKPADPEAILAAIKHQEDDR
jgi:uncharacterized membrane protein